MNFRIRVRVAVLLALGLVVAACSGSRTATSARCGAASSGLVAAVTTGLNDGVTIGNAQVVKSTDFEKVYFMSARLSGAGLSGSDVATWATNDPTGAAGLIFSIDGNAQQFSDWGQNSDISRSDDGFADSQGCARG